MKENERWAGHIAFLTILSALAIGLIAAFAAIFADPDKIHGTFAKGMIIATAALAVASLGFSIFASVKLSNYLVIADVAPAFERASRGASVTRLAGAAFYLLGLASLAVFAFLYVSVFQNESKTEVKSDKHSEEFFIQTLKAAQEASASANIAAQKADAMSASVQSSLRKLDERVAVFESKQAKATEPAQASRPLNSEEWKSIQQSLHIQIDGRKGKGTCKAIRGYQRNLDTSQTGTLTTNQIQGLIGSANSSRLIDDVPCS